MAQDDPRLEQFKQKYQSVLNVIQQQGVSLSHMHVQDGKFFLQGNAPSQEVKNNVWNQIKAVDPTYSDLTCDLNIDPSLPQYHASSMSGGSGGGPQMGAGQTYTVQPGDTLSKISQQFYGSANHYMRIFEANEDLLTDPNKIQVGQKLKIPAQ